MQIQMVYNSNHSPNFGEKLIFDKKLISRATREEKHELAILKKMFKDDGLNNDTVYISNKKDGKTKNIIKTLRLWYKEIKEAKKSEKSSEEVISTRKWWQS